MIGPTNGGRLLRVVIEPTSDSHAWFVRTAWGSSAAQRDHYRRPPPLRDMPSSRQRPEDDPDYTAEVGEPVDVTVALNPELVVLEAGEENAGPKLALATALTSEQLAEISSLSQARTVAPEVILRELVTEALDARRRTRGASFEDLFEQAAALHRGRSRSSSDLPSSLRSAGRRRARQHRATRSSSRATCSRSPATRRRRVGGPGATPSVGA